MKTKSRKKRVKIKYDWKYEEEAGPVENVANTGKELETVATLPSWITNDEDFSHLLNALDNDQ